MTGFRVQVEAFCLDGVAQDALLIDLCDANSDIPLEFGCRAGACGQCLVEVTDGMQNLSPVTGIEQIVLEGITDNPRARLACQISLSGSATFRRLEG